MFFWNGENERYGGEGTDGETKEQWQEVISRWVWLFSEMFLLGKQMGFLEYNTHTTHTQNPRLN